MSEASQSSWLYCRAAVNCLYVQANISNHTTHPLFFLSAFVCFSHCNMLQQVVAPHWVFFFFHFIYYYNPKLGNSFFHSHYTQANTHTQCKGDEWSCGYSAQWAVLGVGNLLKGTSAVPRMWASILQLPVHIVLIWSEWTSRAKSLRTELLPPILFTSASPWVHVWEEVVHQSKVEW